MEQRDSIRQQWIEKIKDLLKPAETSLPLLREINHEIPLINPNLRINHRVPKCPEPLGDKLKEKVDRYLNAGVWVRTSLPSQTLMMVVFKKSGAIRTVIDGRLRNDNTVTDIMPMPDQETIRSDLARARFCSKIDLSDAYEQIRIRPKHEAHTVFATIYGNMISRVMQQGDKNCPATFQRLMNTSFADMIAVFVHCYQDDIFVYLDTLEEHMKHLKMVFQRLRKLKLYLSDNLKKLDILLLNMECLGFFIDDDGIHMDPIKMEKIRDWRTPRNYQDVLRFNGVVQYLAQFLPRAVDFTAPLTGMCSNNCDFVWTDFQDKCFNGIKSLVARAPILKPIDGRINVPIWVLSDASASGVGAWYGQGPTWDTCRPAGFLSCKFTPAQMNYCTWEQELLGVLEVLLRWEDKLMGLKFTIVTDHQALTFFNETSTKSQRWMWWWEYLSRFSYEITYLKGDKNKVADSLSRYFSSDEPGEEHGLPSYVNADSRLDPDVDDLPIARRAELVAMRVGITPLESGPSRPSDRVEEHELLSTELLSNMETRDKPDPSLNFKDKALQVALRHLPDTYKSDKFFAEILENNSH
jgi:hypothetical protein